MAKLTEPLFPGMKTKCVTFSFDDGTLQDERLIALFNERGLKGTFNVNTGFMGINDDGNRNGKVFGHRHIPRERMAEVYAGHELAVHMEHHPWPTRLSDPLVVDEVMRDRLALEEITGAPVRGMAYPYGDFDDRIIGLMRACGIVYSRTTVTTKNFRVPRSPLAWATSCHYRNMGELVPAFTAAGNDVRAFTIWGHTFECDLNDEWELLIDGLDAVSGRDDTWYCTNIELFDYIAAYDALNSSADGSILHNPTATPVCLRLMGHGGDVCHEYEIAPGAIVRI